MAISLKNLLQINGTDRDTVNNTMRRIAAGAASLAAEFGADEGEVLAARKVGGPGRPRLFDRSGALFTSFVLSLTRAGFGVVQAGFLASEWVVQERELGAKFPAFWFANPRDVYGRGLEGCWLASDNGGATLAEAGLLLSDDPLNKTDPAATLVVINRGELVRRVDAIEQSA